MTLSPSAYALSNVVDLYRFLGTQDEDASLNEVQYGGPFATAVPCSVQPDDPIRFFDEKTMRIVQKVPYNVFFAADYGLDVNDKIVWVDDTGKARNLFVFGTTNEAGKGGTFTANAEERR